MEHTLSTIQHLDRLMPESGKIVVVDDGSSDGTKEQIQNEFPEVIILKGDGTLWWSGSINLGANYAIKDGADYVLFLNNDIILKDDFLIELLKGIDEYPNAIVASKILSADEPWKIWSMGGKVDWAKGNFWMVGCNRADDNRYTEPVEVDWLPGMSMMVPRDVFIGNIWLDQKNFPQYAGDSDFTIRAKKAGFPLIVWPTSIVYNKVRNSGALSRLLLGVEPLSVKLLKDCFFSVKSSAAFKTFGRLIMRHAPIWSWPIVFSRFYGFLGLKLLQVALHLPSPSHWINRKRFNEFTRQQTEETEVF